MRVLEDPVFLIRICNEIGIKWKVVTRSYFCVLEYFSNCIFKQKECP